MNLAGFIEHAAPLLPPDRFPNPRQTIRHLLQSSLSMNAMQVHLNAQEDLDPVKLEELAQSLDDLVAGRPLAYVLGSVSFLEWEFAIDERAFIPRPETEALVAMVREKRNMAPSNKLILDLCCGSGVMGLGLALSFPQSQLILAELDPNALEVARSNTQRHQVDDRTQLVRSNLWQNLKALKDIDVLLCNPPYVAGNERVGSEVLEHEPHLALFSDDSGMQHVKSVLMECEEHLAQGALAAFELGHLHREALTPWLETHSWKGQFEWAQDPFGVPRFLLYQV